MPNYAVTYYVCEESACQSCRGDTWVEDPKWQSRLHALDNWAQNSRPGDPPPDLADMAGRPIRIPCSDCKGTGIASRKVDLATALRNIAGEIAPLFTPTEDA